MKKEISFFSLFLYIIASPYLLFTYFYMPLLIQNNHNMAYIIPFILIFISSIIVFLLPKKIAEINYMRLLKKSFSAKIAYVLFLIVSSIINLFIACRVLSELFFYQHHYIIFVIILIISILILSRNKTNILINASTILLLIGLILGFVPYFLTGKVKDYSFLLPMNSSSIWESLLYGLFFILESLSFCLYFSKVNKRFSKLSLMIAILIMMSFFSLELLHIIVLAGTSYFNKMEFLGYLTFFVQDAITYVGNMGFIYLYLIPVIGIMKCSIQLSTLGDILNLKRNVLLDIILGLFLMLVIIFLYKMKIFIFFKTIFPFLIFLLLVLYIFINVNRSDKYEILF